MSLKDGLGQVGNGLGQAVGSVGSAVAAPVTGFFGGLKKGFGQPGASAPMTAPAAPTGQPGALSGRDQMMEVGRGMQQIGAAPGMDMGGGASPQPQAQPSYFAPSAAQPRTGLAPPMAPGGKAGQLTPEQVMMLRSLFAAGGGR